MLLDYIKISTRICRILMLVNAEHGLKASDLSFLYKTYHHKVNVQIILTKCDKLDRKKIFDKTMAIGHQVRIFGHVHPVIIATSAE